MKEYKVQIVQHIILERTIKAESPKEAEEIARKRYRYFPGGLGAVQISVDVKCEISNREEME